MWVPELVDEARPEGTAAASETQERRSRSADTLRRQLTDIIDALGTRELDQLAAFADFLRAKRAARASNKGLAAPPVAEQAAADPEPTSGKVPAKISSIGGD